MAAPVDRTAAFRALHEAGCFVIPNPWDVGSARLPRRCSASRPSRRRAPGSPGRWVGPTTAVTLDEVLGHLEAIAGSVEMPVNADFEGGFAIEPDGVAANVTRAARTGVAGISIEDSTGDDAEPLFAFELAVDRVRAARGGASTRAGAGSC